MTNREKLIQFRDRLQLELGHKPRLGELIHALRQDRGLKFLTNVTDMIDISSQHLGQIESGKRVASPETAKKIAKVLGVDPEELSMMARDEKLEQSGKVQIVSRKKEGRNYLYELAFPDMENSKNVKIEVVEEKNKKYVSQINFPIYIIWYVLDKEAHLNYNVTYGYSQFYEYAKSKDPQKRVYETESLENLRKKMGNAPIIEQESMKHVDNLHYQEKDVFLMKDIYGNWAERESEMSFYEDVLEDLSYRFHYFNTVESIEERLKSESITDNYRAVCVNILESLKEVKK